MGKFKNDSIIVRMGKNSGTTIIAEIRW